MIPTSRRGGPTPDEAEALALSALAYLAADADRLGRFLAETGIEPDTLMRQADTPTTMAAVLDHILADESLLLVFAADAGLKPEQVALAHAIIAEPTPGQRHRP